MEHVEFTIYDRYHLQLVWKGGKEWIERDLSGIFYLFPIWDFSRKEWNDKEGMFISFPLKHSS